MGLFSWLSKYNTTKRLLPDGWKETKVSDNLYITPISDEQQQNWCNKRRQKDKVEKIAQKNGFYLKNDGRSGTIYYAESGKVCEFDFEISGVPEFDLIFYFDSLNNWFFPINLTMTIEDKERIWLQFIDLLKSRKLREICKIATNFFRIQLLQLFDFELSCLSLVICIFAYLYIYNHDTQENKDIHPTEPRN